jgi:ATP-dependent DNA ligase
MLGRSTDVRNWRPQRFGRRAARHVDDPLVEPLWSGIRVLAHVFPAGVEMLDSEGGLQMWPDVAADLIAAVEPSTAVLDGYLTTEPSEGVAVDAAPRVTSPSPAQMARQLVWFGGSANRRTELIDALEEQLPRAFAPGEEVVFVAVDMLAIDGELLLDVPLLERKRLLESVLRERDRARRGMYVRPPVGVWVTTWRTLGFRSMAYKDANSRYAPGEPNDGWAQARIPDR